MNTVNILVTNTSAVFIFQNNKLSVKHNFKKTPKKGKKLKESGDEENICSQPVFSKSTFPDDVYHSESNINTESCSKKVRKSLHQTSRLNKKGKTVSICCLRQVCPVQKVLCCKNRQHPYPMLPH